MKYTVVSPSTLIFKSARLRFEWTSHFAAGFLSIPSSERHREFAWNSQLETRPLITESRGFLRDPLGGSGAQLDRDNKFEIRKKHGSPSDSEFGRTSIGGQSKYLERYPAVIEPISPGELFRIQVYIVVFDASYVT